jgi:hypothetical protein
MRKMLCYYRFEWLFYFCSLATIKEAETERRKQALCHQIKQPTFKKECTILL